MSAVSIEHVSFSYDGKRNALENVSLRFEAGSFTCILGGNGSGKSTLAKLINALLLPDEGSVTVFDRKTDDPHNLFFVRSNAGMVFQNPDDQIVASVVEDDVAFGPENIGVPEDELPQRVAEALAQVGLEGFAHRETHTLSGGQKQRVAFAGMLALQPRILILDEAGAMLDPRGQEELFKVCRTLNQAGLTIIYITHSMDEAALADRVIILEDGAVASDGEPREVLCDVRYLQGLGLDVPFAAKMSALLQEDDIDIPLCLTQDELILALRERGLALAEPTPHEVTCAVSDTTAQNADTSSEKQEPPLLSFEDVWFTYASKHARKQLLKQSEQASRTSHDNASTMWGNDPHEMWALQNINLKIHTGDFFGIAGHTGSGKSTLLQLANGVLQPTKGRVVLDGHDLSNKKEASDAHQKIGLVFQYPERQLFASTVFDDVAFGPRNLGLSEDEVTIRVQESLELMQLEYDEVKTRSPFVLSGGQQRRVAIAGILAMNPEVLVLDEPTAGLDPHMHDHLLALIRNLHEQQKKTIVMVSHNMDDLAYSCNRIVVLNQGKLFAQGCPAQIFERADALSQIGLAIPRTLQLEKDLGLENPSSSAPCRSRSIPTDAELAQRIATHMTTADSSD